MVFYYYLNNYIVIGQLLNDIQIRNTLKYS